MIIFSDSKDAIWVHKTP